MTNSPGLRTFVRNEPNVASRLLLDANSKVHVGMKDALARLIRRLELASGWVAPLGAELLAQIVARVGETFVYADLIARDQPNPDTPQLVFEMLVGVDPPD